MVQAKALASLKLFDSLKGPSQATQLPTPPGILSLQTKQQEKQEQGGIYRNILNTPIFLSCLNI